MVQVEPQEYGHTVYLEINTVEKEGIVIKCANQALWSWLLPSVSPCSLRSPVKGISELFISWHEGWKNHLF